MNIDVTNFNLQKQWQLYLTRVDLEESKMHPIQLIETKRAFFGACAQMLILLRDELTEFSDDQACDYLDAMLQQADDFWRQQVGRQN